MRCFKNKNGKKSIKKELTKMATNNIHGRKPGMVIGNRLRQAKHIVLRSKKFFLFRPSIIETLKIH